MTTTVRPLRLACAGLGLAVAGAIAGCGGVVKTNDLGDSGAGAAGFGGSTPGAGAAPTGATSGGGTGGSKAGDGGKAGGAGKAGGGGGTAGGAGKAGSTGKGGGAGAISGGGSAGVISKGGAGGASQGGSAGTTPAGGSAGGVACPELPCPAIACPLGSQPYLPPNACCPVCGPNCAAVDCGSPVCQPNQIVETPPGQCCPVCTTVFTPPPICNQAGYVSLRSQLEQKYQTGPCSSNSDCTVVAENFCGIGDCGTAISLQLAESFMFNLRSYAQDNCASCPPAPPVPCPAGRSVACLDGQCSLIEINR